jgi:hypothetical protein
MMIAIVVVAVMMITVVVIAVVVIAVMMVAIVMVEVMMVEIVMMIFHHMFEIPARLLIIMFLVIFADQSAIADTQTGIPFPGPAIKIASAMPDDRAIAAVPLARVVDVAVMLAVPRLKMTIVVAPPIAIVAIFGAAPPSRIGFTFAEAMLCVAFMPAIPAVPMAFVMAARTFAAAVIFAMTPAVAVATVMELDCRDRIERIKQDGIDDGDAAIFVRTARVARNRARRREHDQRGSDCAKDRLPGSEFAHRFDILRHGDLP